MTELYRFRSMPRLLGEDGELETQTIYFASPADLNDPMEGFRDIVWHGDHIAWTNLFKHYINCLARTYLLVQIAADSDVITPDLIPVTSSWDDAPSPKYADLLAEIWSRMVGDVRLPDIAGKLATYDREVRNDELLFYLSGIHLHAAATIQQAHMNHGLLPAALPDLSLSGETVLTNSNILELLSEPFDEGISADQLFSIWGQVKQSQALKHSFGLYRTSSGTLARNIQALLLDFPQDYVTGIVEKLLWPSWYATCFSKTPHNSSLWGSYGDAHKGACLIFRAADDEHGLSLALSPPGGPARTISFHDIDYTAVRNTVDFFRSMGRLPTAALLRQWFTGADGNISDCAAHLTSGDGQDAWREQYWNEFLQDITKKTKDWAHEEESRLVHNGGLDGALTEEQKKHRYNWDVLRGIIFGIRTSNHNKMRIIDIVRMKCAANGVRDFQFWQAYYSPQDGEMKSYALDIEVD